MEGVTDRDQREEIPEDSEENNLEAIHQDMQYRFEIEPFINHANHVFTKYEQSHEWLSMAIEIWNMYNQFMADTAQEPYGRQTVTPLFNEYFKKSFSHLYKVYGQEANMRLSDLLKRVESNLVVERATSFGSRDKITMYEFFVDKIKEGLGYQEQKSEINHAPLSVLDVSLVHEEQQGGQQKEEYDGFEDFCFDKINELEPEIKARMLRTKVKSKELITIKKNWHQEFCHHKGVKGDYETQRSSISRAIDRHRLLID